MAKLNGPVVTAVVAVVAMTGVVAAFAMNASPYVNVAQAKKIGGDNLHIAGKLDKGSIQVNQNNGRLTFMMVDEQGTPVKVEHHGDRPASMKDATTVVAIGGMKGDLFISRNLILKCPSKYEEKERKPFAFR